MDSKTLSILRAHRRMLMAIYGLILTILLALLILVLIASEQDAEEITTNEIIVDLPTLEHMLLRRQLVKMAYL